MVPNVLIGAFFRADFKLFIQFIFNKIHFFLLAPQQPDGDAKKHSAASALNAALEVASEGCRFWRASQGITTAAANKRAIPARLR